MSQRVKILIIMVQLCSVLFAAPLCKDTTTDKSAYIECLTSKTQTSKSVEDMNFLAGVLVVAKEIDKAIPWYEKSASKNDAKAMYYLGGIYQEELKDYSKAIEWFKKSADKNYEDAMCRVGDVYVDDLNQSKQALEYFDMKIEKGSILASVCKGNYYLHQREFQKSKKAYLKGANKDRLKNLIMSESELDKKERAEANYHLGSLHSAYLEDNDKAIEYYKKAAKENHLKSIHNLGSRYEAKAEYEESLKWYKISSAAGDNRSLLNIAHVYRKQKLYKKAEEAFIKLSKERGDPEGYRNLGLMEQKEFNSFVLAQDWFLKAFEMGDSKAAVNIAYLYVKKKEYDKAIEWFEKGSPRKNEKIAFSFARFYEEELKDYPKTIEWYKIAHTLGGARYSYSLGYFYDDVIQDSEKAIKWYKIASEEGFNGANLNLGTLYRKDLRDREKAIYWYKKSAALGEKRAVRILKEMGVEQ